MVLRSKIKISLQKYWVKIQQKNIFNEQANCLNEWGGLFNEGFLVKNNFQKKFACTFFKKKNCGIEKCCIFAPTEVVAIP